jgi:hypothetical protein
MLPRPLTEEEDIARAMEDQPAWARALWATPQRRLLLSLGVLAVGAWILVSALSDPDEFFSRGQMAAGFLAAPLLVFMFGLQAIEAIGDIVHNRKCHPGLPSRRAVARRARPSAHRPLPRRHGPAPHGADRLSTAPSGVSEV